MTTLNLAKKRKLPIPGHIILSLGLLAGLFLLGQLLAPGFIATEQIMTILSLSSFLGILALGQTIVIVSGGEGIDLSIGALVSLSSVIAAQIIDKEAANLPMALLTVLVVGFLLGLMNGVGVTYFKIPPLVMTLAMSSVVQGIALVYTGGQPKGGASEFLKTLGTGRTGPFNNILFVWTLLAAVAIFLLQRTRMGKVLYGVGSNPVTATLSGANSSLVKMIAFAACGAVSALGGLLLLGYTGTAYLDIGSAYLMPTVAAVVIGGISLAGGKGGYTGVVIGTITLTTLSSLLLALRMGEGGRQVVYGLVLLLLLTAYSRKQTDK